MRQFAETVLNGHPDKFCDLLADAIIQETYNQDPNADAQIEVAMWRNCITLNGHITSTSEIELNTADVISHVADACGFLSNHPLHPTKCTVADNIERVDESPAKKNAPSNDQSIIIGYAGYDCKTNYLRPEQFLSWFIREKLSKAIISGPLQGHGPDGKILVSMREEPNGWFVDQILVSMQQSDALSFQLFYAILRSVIQHAYHQARQMDARWKSQQDDITWLINPYGLWKSNDHEPDSGQTGRKLVMDFYGPRIPLGGGAIYGKGWHHIDRLASLAARAFAVEHVKRGADEVHLQLCYAPGIQSPLQIECIMNVKPCVELNAFFQPKNMRALLSSIDLNYSPYALGTFYNQELPFNQPGFLDAHRVSQPFQLKPINA
ncbi:MAG: methionine adenosyltransferase domain-containing protein [Flavobacteriales bacterium]